MTNNLGDVRHAMASQPSLYSEERKRLRIQAWEQRNQEVCQEKKGHPENVPLFGKPYKTIKWDELSCRIQRMLGSYEDGKDPELNPGGFAKDPPGHGPAATPPDPRQAPPAGDSDAAPSFHGGLRPAPASTPPLPPPVSVRPPPARNPRSATAAAAADPRSPRQQDEEDEDALDMEYTRLPQMLTTLSPLAQIESPLHSSGDRFDRGGDSRDAFDPRAEPPRRSLVSPIRAPQMAAAPEPTQTPDESRLPPSTAGGGGGGAPSQTFPPPLASKASGVVVTRKPTAYVRPMDGQDQVIMESPELKPSPEPYEPLPDKMGHHHHHNHHHHHHNNKGINNSSALSKTLPRSLETRPNEAQCVEDILREMTHSWPPLLTTIQTPGAPQTAPRSPPTAKIVEHVQKQLPGKEHYDSPPTESSVSSQQSSACVAEAAHSSGVESASSSDSESSSASDSESESARRRPAHPPRSSPAEVKTTAPHGDWQLANWIRSGQQNPGSASQTPPHRPAPPSQRSSNTREAAAAAAVATALRPPGDYKPHVSPDQEESSYSQAAEPQRFRSSSGGPQKYPAKPGVCKSPSRPKSADGSRAKTACKKHAAKPGRTLSPEHPTAAPAPAAPAPPQGVTAQAPPADDKSSSSSLTFLYRPKVKTKTKAKRGSPATESPSLPKPREAAKCVPKESAASAPRCPCGAFPGRCVCPAALSPGRPDRAPATPSVVEVSVGVKAERAKRPKGPKKAPKTVKLEAAAAQRPDTEPLTPAPKAFASLLVKIDLSLLSRVPGVSTVAQETTSSSSTTTTAAAVSSSSTTTTTTSSSSSSSSSRSKSVPEKGGKGSQPTKGGPTKNNNNNNNNKKRPAETDKNPPKKKQKMEKKAKVAEQQPGRAAVKTEDSVVVAKEEKQETPKKCAVPQKQQQQQPPPQQQQQQQQCSDPKEQSTDARPGKDGNPKHRRSTKKHKEHSKTGKKAPKSILTVQASAEPAKATAPGRRPMLSFEDRRHPVKHYIKEAKKLKHKADAESDKVGKAFGYLEAAMFFAESGVAMETEPETTKSPYSMYEDTVELIKFTLKQKNSGDSWALPSENDFTVLCLKCQSLLQMAMFRCKHKVASKYSKTLKTHFLTCKPSPDASLGSSNSRTTDAASPLSVAAASPAFAAPGSTTSSGSSGPGSNHSCGGGEGPTTTTSTTSTTSTTGGSSSTTVSIPKIIHHVASSYVNITALFVSAHDMWEKAEALTQKSSGVLSELNVHMEPLSLSSGMKAMVQYTRQALHWLRLERQATWSSGGGGSSNPSN